MHLKEFLPHQVKIFRKLDKGITLVIIHHILGRQGLFLGLEGFEDIRSKISNEGIR